MEKGKRKPKKCTRNWFIQFKLLCFTWGSVSGTRVLAGVVKVYTFWGIFPSTIERGRSNGMLPSLSTTTTYMHSNRMSGRYMTFNRLSRRKTENCCAAENENKEDIFIKMTGGKSECRNDVIIQLLVKQERGKVKRKKYEKGRGL